VSSCSQGCPCCGEKIKISLWVSTLNPQALVILIIFAEFTFKGHARLVLMGVDNDDT
jgi:hypothetical protein